MEFKRDISHIQLTEGTKQWINYLNNRIKQNKNFLGCFIGQTGSGKSYSAISLQELIHHGVIETDNIFMKSSDFIKRLVDTKLPPGTVLVWDEAGKDLNSKQWASKANKVMAVVFQVFRRENIIVLFTLPYFSFLDSDARKLVHCIFETQRIDHNVKEVIVKPLLIQTNQVSGKMYRKRLQVQTGKNGLVPIKRIRLPMPNLVAIKDYEDKKEKFSMDVYKEAYESLMDSSEDKKGNKLNKIHEGIYEMIKQGATKEDIMKHFYIDKNGTFITYLNTIKKVTGEDMQYLLIQNRRNSDGLAPFSPKINKIAN